MAYQYEALKMQFKMLNNSFIPTSITYKNTELKQLLTSIASN